MIILISDLVLLVLPKKSENFYLIERIAMFSILSVISYRNSKSPEDTYYVGTKRALIKEANKVAESTFFLQ